VTEGRWDIGGGRALGGMGEERLLNGKKKKAKLLMFGFVWACRLHETQKNQEEPQKHATEGTSGSSSGQNRSLTVTWMGIQTKEKYTYKPFIGRHTRPLLGLSTGKG